MDTQQSWSRFTESDWNAFAGAESFDDGSAPLILHFETPDGTDATAIVSSEGFEIVRTWADVEIWALVVPNWQPQRVTNAMMTLTERPTEREDWQALGFELVG